MDTANRIKSLRKQLGIKRAELARKSAVSLSYLNEIERGIKSPTEITLRKICSALGLTLAEFFSDQDLELSPEEHQIVEKVRKLPPEKIKVLNAVLDTWDESEQKSIQKTDLKKVKDNNADHLCQLLDLNVIVPTIKGQPLTKEEKEKFIKYIRNNPNLLPDEDNDTDFLSSFAAHDEGKGLLTTNPELINILKASEKINDMLQKYLDKKTDKGE